MTGFLLDTNVISEAMKPAPNPRVTAFLQQKHDLLWLSVVALYELEYGMRLLPEGRRRSRIRAVVAEMVASYGERILPLGRNEAQRAAWLRARAHRSGKPVQIGDALIAGTADANALVVATRNASHFAAFGIEVVNPWNDAASRSAAMLS